MYVKYSISAYSQMEVADSSYAFRKTGIRRQRRLRGWTPLQVSLDINRYYAARSTEQLSVTLRESVSNRGHSIFDLEVAGHCGVD